MITIYIDGSAKPNPGVGCYGYVIFEDGVFFTSSSGILGGEMTNNECEYGALQIALETVVETFNLKGEVEILTDSQLVAKQLMGEWGVKQGPYIKRFSSVLRRLKWLEDGWSVKWIPREQNLADRECRKALKS